MHPLQSFAGATDSLQGVYCCIEGDAEATARLVDLAESLGMVPMTLQPEAKELYHAAAVMACNYLVALEDVACELMEAAGLDADQALKALLPLIRGTVDNLQDEGLPNALTGPIARGDSAVVRRHLEAIQARAPDLLALYQALGRRALRLARRSGDISPEAADDLQDALQ
jgi:predicted short-subunit dehydrogenase-like oxidoreductase (DUF2520 family)